MKNLDAKTVNSTITPDRHLFWFVKEDKKLDLNDPSELDMYIQQVITRGGTEDVRVMLRYVDFERLVKSMKRIENFLPDGVGDFWKNYINESSQ